MKKEKTRQIWTLPCAVLTACFLAFTLSDGLSAGGKKRKPGAQQGWKKPKPSKPGWNGNHCYGNRCQKPGLQKPKPKPNWKKPKPSKPGWNGNHCYGNRCQKPGLRPKPKPNWKKPGWRQHGLNRCYHGSNGRVRCLK